MTLHLNKKIYFQILFSEYDVLTFCDEKTWKIVV